MATTTKNTTETKENTSYYRPLLFTQPSVRQLKSESFYLDKKDLICLIYEDCFLILFYTDNRESENLCRIWSVTASQAAGSIFAAVHIGIESKIAANFALLSSEPSHPFYWARMQAIPFIMVYRRGYPTSIYNGERAVQSILDFALTLACDVNYHEYTATSLSMIADNNLEMTGTRPNKRRTNSRQFTVNAPLRGYDPSYPVKLVTPEETNTFNKTTSVTTTKTTVVPVAPTIPVVSTTTETTPVLQQPISTVTIRTTTTSKIAMPIRRNKK